jgi:hypothetical protein
MSLKNELQEHFQLFFPVGFMKELSVLGAVDIDSTINVLNREYIKKVYKYILNNYQLIDNYGGVKFKGSILEIDPEHDLYSNGTTIKFDDYLGLGAIDALFKAIKTELNKDIDIYHYGSSAISNLVTGFDKNVSSESNVITFIGVKVKSGEIYWGVGLSSNALRSAVDALLSSINRLEKESR